MATAPGTTGATAGADSPTGGFATKAEAERGLRAELTSLDTGRWSARSRLTVGDFLDGWLLGKAALRPSTARSYAGHVALHLRPAIGHLELVALRASDVARLNAGLVDKGLSPSSVRRINATLRAALADALRADLVVKDVARQVELPATVRTDVQVWEPWQVGQFLDYLDSSGERLAALFHVAAMRGLRRGDLCGLRWKDLDLDAGSLRVAQQRVAVGWEVITGAPKTKRSARTISLDSTSVEALRAHKARQAAERLAAGAAWVDSGLVFVTPTGEGLHPAVATKIFPRLTAAAGLPTIKLHALRHTAASMALSAGVPLKVVSEQLGHSSVMLTADIYSHVSPALAHDSAQRVASLVPRRGRPAG